MTGRAKPPRHLSISATDAEWDAVRDHAARRGQTVARYVVGLVERVEARPSFQRAKAREDAARANM